MKKLEKPSMKVLVTGATRNSCMAVIRGLSQKRCEIVGADERSLPFKMHSRYTGPYYSYPPGYGDDFVDAIIKIVQKEKPDVFLPVAGTKEISKHRQLIERYTNVLLPDYENYMTAFDNHLTLEACRKLHIGCPNIRHEKDVLHELENNRNRQNPVRFVLKPRSDIGGSRGLGIFHDEKSFHHYKKAGEKYGEAFITEYIPGPTSNMRTVNLLFDQNSELIASFTTRKIRQWPNSGGISALTVSTHEPDLVDFILPFFKKYRWQGFAEAEIKIDERDGMPKLIEINPRFCGYIGFPIQCGVNFPWVMCQLITGKRRPQMPAYSSGIKYIHWPTYLKAAYSEWRENRNRKEFFSKIREEIKGKKVSNNMEWQDLKIIAAKMIFELLDRGKSSDVWN
ncbi:MAG: hypothetical protein C4518_18230 [Desulfobacteraceae bacterium]|nr:MAG: hypothetical protein C4518_18230 [Desulfobacteraceae bacterium]